MEFVLNIQEQMLLELLRSSLTNTSIDSSLFDSISEQDWKDCYQLAHEQGVVSLAWDGILKLSPSLYPPKQIKLSWALAVEKQERRYAMYVKRASELCSFFTGHGIASVQLKGTGLSSYYPVPVHRDGGDIDLYTFSADKSIMDDIEAAELSDQFIENVGIKVDRTDPKNSFFYYHNIPVENHKHFLETDAMKSAVELDKYLKTVLKPEKIVLLDGKYEMQVPSPEFNTLFLAFHAIQHYGNGLCLHHFCDWACLLNRYGLTLPKVLHDEKLISLIHVLTAFTNRYLGTQIKVEYQDEALQTMIRETLRPPYTKHYEGMSKLQQLVYKTKRFNHYLQLRKQVMGESCLKGIWHSIRIHMLNPKKVFDEGC